MKKLIGSFLAILFFMGLALDANAMKMDEAKLETFKSNIAASLKSENNGVQFWSLFLISRLKSDMPSLDLSQYNKELNRLADRDDSELIRINAKMTYLYLNEPELVETVRVLDRENPLVFYSQLYIAKYNKKFNLENVDPVDQIKELVSQIEILESEM